MKKIALIVFAVLLKTVLLAQEQPKFGLKGGLNLAKLKATQYASSDLDFRASAHVGGLAHIHLTPQWALQPEVVYSGQGMKQQYQGSNYTWKLDYLNIPVMIQYMFNNGFRIEAGPQLGILLGAKFENDETLKNDLKTTDFSVGAGISYLSNSGLGVGVRYNHGVTNINNRPNRSTYELNNRVLQLGLFYLFDHSHKAKSR
ncbi:MAG: PorT family protein [Bacteroidota bacterium]|nr:PorT family protein [Flavisolibacter sp.]MBD0374161.1 PorT family protein [Flavisolibacter sp.]MDQ3844227.1 PorT family protein [Bacteroidota bacterium]